jgi:membrane fusion protein, multidrug efflux system
MQLPLHSAGAQRALPALFLALVAATACSKSQARPQRPPVTVAVAVAKRADVPYIVQANGVVTPIQSASVSAQVSGIVTRVAFHEGQEVAKGQLLFQIDPRPYENTYLQARANYQRDSANAGNAAAQRDRYDRLVSAKVITEMEAQTYQTTAATTAAVVRADSALMATAKYNLDNTSVRAPISGKTGAVLVREGNLVSNGGQALVVINQIRPITVRFAVPSSELPRLQRYATNGGLPVTAVPGGGTSNASPLDSTQGSSTAESTPMSDALAAQAGADVPPEHGSLSFIDNSVDTTTGTLQLKATFDNKDGNLWVGQYASTSMELFIERGALVVPSHALVTGQKGTYVYTLDAENRAVQHAVAVERTLNGLAIISAGVNDGDRVVIEGQSRLTPGAKASLGGAGDSGAVGAGQPGGPGGQGATGGRRGGRRGRGATGGAAAPGTGTGGGTPGGPPK